VAGRTLPGTVKVDPEAFFEGHPLGLEVFHHVRARVSGIGPADVRATRSQVAFRRRRGFAYLWLPGQYLAHPAAEVVLSVAFPERIDSPRWKEVVQPAVKLWMHHLKICAADDVDDEVGEWLREAYEAAA
jgi:hypothetical protein